ncbi:hypothetical protein Trydic_g17213 [Trypoxylus dichotomus]
MVYTCSYCKRKCIKGIGCHSFPKDRKLCDRWLIACNFDLHPKNNTLKLKLCSLHFEDDCFILNHNGRKLLKRNAIPTLLHNDKVKPSNTNVPVINSGFCNTLVINPEDVQLKCEIGEVKITGPMKDEKFLDATPNAAAIKCEPIDDDCEATSSYTISCPTDFVNQNDIKLEYDIDKVKVECANFTEDYNFSVKYDHTYPVVSSKPKTDHCETLAEYTVASLDFSGIEPCDISMQIKEECEI